MSRINFDFIIIGGGSAGCVLAERLSKDPNNSVCLLERGGRDTSPWIHIPATFFKVIEKGKDVFFYSSDVEETLGNRPTLVPQGNVLGGGSSINAMVYVRGQAEDYNHWASLGCAGWAYEDVLPVFKKLEDNESLSGPFHGVGGELKVSDRRYGHPLSSAFIRAAQEVGIKHSDDFNGAGQEGVGYYQSTTYLGRRWSSAKAFLDKARKRSNLTIVTQAEVQKIVIENGEAQSVKLIDGREFYAAREIILSAGGIGSPKILQLSGIGNGQQLRAHGIDVVSDLQGVGENYQDHLEATVQAETIDPISIFSQDKGLKAVWNMAQYLMNRTGVLSSTVVESGGFVDTSNSGRPDLQFHVLPTFSGFADRSPTNGHGISINPCFLRPYSRGTVKLRSADARDAVDFRANSLSDERDVQTLMRGVRLGVDILQGPSLKKLLKRQCLPAPGVENSDAELASFIRSIAKTVYHPSGTCKMGADDDPSAVLNSKLEVRGVRRLRVADASVMPTLLSGNTNAPAMMIGARTAEFILAKS